MKRLSHYLKAKERLHPDIVNWRENNLNDSLFYSYRSTLYDRTTYPSRLHYHDYYELVVFVEGDIRYICESDVYRPNPGEILLIPPGKMHMSMIIGDTTLYKRHVFYLYPDAFDAMGGRALTDFLGRAGEGLSVISPTERTRLELFSLLHRLDAALQSEDSAEQALGLGLVIQIFYFLGSNSPSRQSTQQLPENVRKIRQYIDENFSTIASVEQVAEHFFYSREYLSRLFKKHFNTTVADYLRKRRIAESQTLIAQSIPLSDVCYRVGFESPTTFIRAFSAVTHMTPSEYRRSRGK